MGFNGNKTSHVRIISLPTTSDVSATNLPRSKIGISRGWGSKSRAGVSVRTSGLAGAGSGGPRVFLNGLDVTPQSLFTTSIGGKSSKDGKRTSVGAHDKRPSAGAGAVCSGVSPQERLSQSVEALQNDVEVAATASLRQGDGGAEGTNSKPPSRRKREVPIVEDVGLPEKDLNELIAIELRETPTVMLLEVRGSTVATDSLDFSRCASFRMGYGNRASRKPSLLLLCSSGLRRR